MPGSTSRTTARASPADFLPHVFEFFRQADSSNTRRQSGVGIGLALVHQLVELHGGRIEAHSAGENQGSCFSVWFPLYVVPDAGSAAVAPAALDLLRERRRDGGGAPVPPVAVERRARAPVATKGDQGHRLEGVRALVIDDDETSVLVLRDLLEDESAQVSVATRAADALELAKTTDFDVVISDIAMPEIDGHAMLRKLRAGERNAEVPAIACTGFGSPEDIARAQRSGFVAQFTKPIEVERLVAVVRDLVAAQRKA